MYRRNEKYTKEKEVVMFINRNNQEAEGVLYQANLSAQDAVEQCYDEARNKVKPVNEIILSTEYFESLTGEQKPCEEGLDNWIEHYNDFKGPFLQLLDLEKISISDKIWVAFQCIFTKEQKEEFLFRCVNSAMQKALSVLHIFEEKMPGDTRVRDCLNTIDNMIKNRKFDKDAAWDAGAAWAAARDAGDAGDAWAAGDAAWAAWDAGDAAWAAGAAARAARAAGDARAAAGDAGADEETKQIQFLRDIYNESNTKNSI